MKILLVKPDISSFSVGFAVLARVAPYELLMVAASVPQHECRILDMRLEDDDAFERLLVQEFKPDLIGLTSYTAESFAAKALARRAKAVLPNVPVVLGGYHATMATDDVLDEPAIDFAVCGEGEVTFPALVDAIARGGPFEDIPGIAFRKGERRVMTAPRPQVEDLDTLPFPDWSLAARYQPEYYLGVFGTAAGIESTRGCPFDCNFCSVWVFNRRRYRKKSAGRVMAELERLPDGIQVAAFLDDEFWADERRSLELAGLIAERKKGDWRGNDWHYWAQVRTSDIARHPQLVEQWAAVGLKVLLLGIESHKEEELVKLHHKRNTGDNSLRALETIRQYGVEAWGCFILNPEWEERDFQDLEEFVLSQEIAFPQFTVLTPLPGTPLSDRLAQEEGIRHADIPYPLLDFMHVTYPKARLPLPRFYELMAKLYRDTSLGQNLAGYRRAVRNGVIPRDWLRTELGQRITDLFGQLSDPESYLKTHRLLGERV